MFGHILSSISLYVWFFQGFVLKTTLLLKLDQLQELYIIYVAVYTLLIYLLSTLVISRIYQVIHVYIYIYIHTYISGAILVIGGLGAFFRANF